MPILFKIKGNKGFNVIGIISYEGHSIKVSSQSLKRVIRGEAVYPVQGLPSCFLGVIVSGKIIIPVLSKIAFNSYLEKTFNINISSVLEKNTVSRSLFAFINFKEHNLLIPVNDVISVLDNCEKGKADSLDSEYIELECNDLFNYILLQSWDNNEI